MRAAPDRGPTEQVQREGTPNGPRGESATPPAGEKENMGKGNIALDEMREQHGLKLDWKRTATRTGESSPEGGSLRRPDRQQHSGSHYDTSRTTPRLAQDMAPVSGVRRPGPPQHRRGRTQPGTADAKARDLRGAVGARREHAQCSLGHEPSPLHRRAGGEETATTQQSPHELRRTPATGWSTSPRRLQQ